MQKLNGKSAKTLKALVALTLCGAMLSGCGKTETSNQNNNSQADQTSAETTANETTLSEKNFIATSENVKLLGRTDLNEDILWLAHSASGVEFTFTGTTAEVTVVGDSMATGGSDGNYARFAVYVNDKRVLDEIVTTAEKTYEICSAEKETENTVRIIKLSESANSTIGIKNIKVNSIGNIAPTAKKDLTIEFIGDSITCGYGVDDENKSHHFSTATEDATRAYAYKTAQLLNADYSLVSYSGYGIISGYSGDGKKQTSQLVPTYYDKFGFSYGNYNGYNVADVEWDFTTLVPDVIVINLGTNDYSYCKADKEKMADFTENYTKFIEQVRKDNPKAYIVCTLGVMGANLFESIETAVADYVATSKDEKVSTLQLAAQDGKDGYAADWHPTEATHTKVATAVSDYIKTLIA